MKNPSKPPLRLSMAVSLGGLVLLGLGVLGAFLLPSSGAQGTATYTYPTKPPPPPSTTKPPPSPPQTTTAAEDTTTTVAAPETTTTETTTTAETTAAETTTTTPSSVPSGPTRLRVRHNATLGATILVDQGGMTLYHLIAEKKGLLCTGPCAKVWPPFLLRRGTKPLPGRGVSRLRIGMVKRPDGRLQLTYAGFALYRYSGDELPGDVNGQGFRHLWFAVGPSGLVVMHSG